MIILLLRIREFNWFLAEVTTRVKRNRACCCNRIIFAIISSLWLGERWSFTGCTSQVRVCARFIKAFRISHRVSTKNGVEKFAPLFITAISSVSTKLYKLRAFSRVTIVAWRTINKVFTRRTVLARPSSVVFADSCLRGGGIGFCNSFCSSRYSTFPIIPQGEIAIVITWRGLNIFYSAYAISTKPAQTYWLDICIS